MDADRLALEYMVLHTYNLVNRILGASEETIAQVEEAGRFAISTTPLKGVDPAIADHLTASYAEALQRLQAQARQMRAGASTREA